ncbi:spherical body protein, putative [Babesia ovis]|uniref:Spherical body protein, putative n=1 Tax=Babesia ovis TaxID=5869 RepID=A0A9W5TA89_BABOV|nr:spherical body protein, putative [Babesia ovis]
MMSPSLISLGSILLSCAIPFGKAINLLDNTTDDLAIYPGQFSSDGFYRMFVSNKPTDGVINYGGVRLIIPEDIIADIVYIEEYRRFGTFYLELNTSANENSAYKSSDSKIYRLSSGNATAVSNSELHSFIDGPVVLYLNVADDANIHPRIVRSVSEDGGCVTYGFMTFDDFVKNPSWRGKPGFLISTILNSDFPVNDHGITTSVVLFHAVRVSVDHKKNKGQLLLESRHLKYVVEPKTGGITAISPVGIPAIYWEPNTPALSRSVKAHLAVTIDLSELVGRVPNVIAVRDVLKNFWTYSRYEVVLFGPVKDVTVTVVNTMRLATIYTSSGKSFITHVERFINHVSGAEFVVVHELYKTPTYTTKRKHIFELRNADAKGPYTELFKVRKKHIDLVLNAINDADDF